MEIEKADYDHNLYSRQEITYGAETMRKLVKLKVLVVGVTGVGVEVAKNVVLAGPARLGLCDFRASKAADRQWNFFLTEEKVAKQVSRAESVARELADMNSNVKIDVIKADSFEEAGAKVSDFDVTVVCELFSFELMNKLNAAVRAAKKKLIVAVGLGLAGFVFDDFGLDHKVTDKNGEQEKSAIISNITEDGLVTVHEDKRHDLEVGDLVRLKEIVGMEKLNGHVLKINKVPSPFTFVLEPFPADKFGTYQRNGIVEEVKGVVDMAFEPLQAALELNELPDCDMDFEHPSRTPGLRLLLARLWPALKGDEKGDARPALFDTSAYEKIAAALKAEVQAITDADKRAGFEKFLATDLPFFFTGLAKAELSPVSSFIGGIAAQEAIKVIGKYTPIRQLFIHEFYSTVLKDKKWAEIERAGDGQAAVIGAAAHQALKAAKIFMVGAGALGCELLKMCALMNVSEQGKLVCTDDDSIEVSNLNRQFLFRREHVGSLKSVRAIEAARAMNPAFKAEAAQSRVASNTENVFTDEFWDGLDFVLNAVDNVAARQYVDQKCVFHWKPLFDSGTLGTKCNTQVVYPGVTECYSDSKDPPEKQIPMCTLRSFPSQIEHVIEWSRSQFKDLFVEPSKFFAEFFTDPHTQLQEYKRDLPQNPVKYRELGEVFDLYLGLFRNPTPGGYVQFARDYFQFHFYDAIKQLITLFPPDYVDKEGRHFWTFPKRPPTPIPFGHNEAQFILHLVHVLAQVAKPSFALPKTVESVEHLLATLPPARKLSINPADRDKLITEKPAENTTDLSVLEEKLHNFAELAPKLKDKMVIQEVEFEKDDDANGHIDFLTDITRYRATNYAIEPAERYKVKSIAGRIIPAIATTTASVVGAIGIEMYKFAVKAKPVLHRNFFGNLALNIYNFSEPLPPVVVKDKDYDEIVLGPVKAIPPKYNTWSRTELKGPLTVAQFREHMSKQFGFNVSGIMAGKKHIWNIYEPAKFDQRLPRTIESVAAEEGIPRETGRRYLQLALSAETPEGVDVLTPYVKYTLG